MIEDKTAFLMAHGQRVWWRENYSLAIAKRRDVPRYKQLLPIKELPLVQYTALMLRKQGFPVTLCAPRDLLHYARGMDAWSLDDWLHFKDVPTLWHSIQRTFPSWAADLTLILLGDVLFSTEAIERLVLGSYSDYPINFLCRLGPNAVTGKQHREMFAFGVQRSAYGVIMDMINTWIKGYPANEGQHAWKLWDLLEKLEGHSRSLVYVHDLKDYTDDVDTVEEYERFWPLMVSAAEEENG